MWALKSGEHDGPKPVDRGKYGSEIHLITERVGLPPSVGIDLGGEPARQPGGRHWWTIARTVSWLAGFRRLHRRYGRQAEHFLAFTSISCTLICYRRLTKCDGVLIGQITASPFAPRRLWMCSHHRGESNPPSCRPDKSSA